MRPQFKSEFAKGLCSSTDPADEFLFGGNTAKRIKEIAELNKNKVYAKLSHQGHKEEVRDSLHIHKEYFEVTSGEEVEPFVVVALVPLAINSSSNIFSRKRSRAPGPIKIGM